MRSHFGILLLLTLSFFDVTAQTCQGLLWKISGNGLEQSSYLYGTMHVSNKVAFHLSDSFYKAISSVDVVSLEINPETWMETMTTDDYVADKMGNAFSVRGSNQNSGFYKSLFEKKIPTNKELGRVIGTDLGILNSLLYRTSNYSADFQEDTYLDLFIFQAGKKQGKEITGLEKLGATMRLNELASKPILDPVEKKRLELISERNQYELMKLLDGKPYGEKIQDAYRLGDLDLLDSMSRLASSARNHDLIIVHRNIGMANAMDSIMSKKSLFAGIGAAHLPNDYGVIALLREKGYQVTAVDNDKTPWSKKIKEGLQETFIKHDFQKQTSFDGSYSVHLPGKLYEFPESNDIRMAAYPDMVNGAKYTITRINTYGPLYDISQQRFMDKLDSLFFENVPGKILEKSRIEVDGIPGFHILNETKKRNKEQYRIFINPIEILIFKASGKKNFVLRTEVQQFFENIEFFSGSKALLYSPKNNAYKINLPGTSMYEAENSAFMRGYWEKVVQSFDESGDYFSVINRGHTDIEFMEEDSFELKHILSYYITHFGYEVGSVRLDSLAGYTSLIATAQKSGKRNLNLRAVVVGNQYYLLTALSNDKTKAERFLNDIKFRRYQYSRPFTIQVDSLRLFKVTSSVRPPEARASFYNYYDMQDEDLSYQAESKAAVYYNKETDETIYVRFYKFHKYDHYENLDSLWNHYRDEFLQHGFYINKEKAITSDSLDTYEIEVGDTNSRRNIYAKHFLVDGVIYSLYTETNSNMEKSKFVSTFYSTFTPLDTVIGLSILQDKGSLFLKDIQSEDSLSREVAYRSFGTIEFSEDQVLELIKAYKYGIFEENKQDIKVRLLKSIGKLKSREVETFLVGELLNVGDTLSLQLPILYGLANQQTRSAQKAFLKNILEETPLTKKLMEIDRLFIPFKDSLQLAKELYPEILQLVSLPEYKEKVYDLLSVLVDSGIVNARIYRKYWRHIAWEGVNEVKRQRGLEDNQSKDFYKTESRRSLYSYNDLLKDYATLLYPYAKKQKAHRYFQKAELINSPVFKIDLALVKLKAGATIQDTYWAEVASNKNDRIVLYQRLRDINRLDLFPAAYNTDSLAMSLYAQKARINQYKDSMLFIHKSWVSDVSDSGYLYFYKIKDSDEE
mgnify:CR=1 FL=1